MRAWAIAILVVAMLVGGVVGFDDAAPAKPFPIPGIFVPFCERGEIHVGKGEWSGRRWTWYKCVRRVDFQGVPAGSGP